MTIKWEKTREEIYSRNTNIATKKRWKKIVWKNCEIRFLLTYEYRDQKIVGKKRVKEFFKNTRIRYPKNIGKKSSGKSAKKIFFKTHQYRVEKSGEKNARKKFSKNTRLGYLKIVGKKSSGKSAK